MQFNVISLITANQPHGAAAGKVRAHEYVYTILTTSEVEFEPLVALDDKSGAQQSYY